ncbi:1-hydroxycarotenoid 3,4-desaturase CrtD [Roseateles amylovorans]|uniref:Phytoene desaturase family protein n=1 Tax=Roseateles amylovorans TaxID=2978473 RepID=A0ABY6B053_9BURK|nr:1-hydroxycarotenoid 3,4-desaturase CrtD [Roseateles amylovorans]UXH78582.1 phytoene desaturase family protein [Roseateles amylovorans]
MNRVRPLSSLTPPRVVVIGAGMGGLAAAALLARQGVEVQLLERADAPGGKMRPVELGALRLDGGPTVLTMRWVFEALFDRLGTSLDQHVHLHRSEVLARHAWSADERLDLHADLDQSIEAIAAFSSRAEATRYRAFCQRAAQVFATLDPAFIRASRPSPVSLTWRVLRQQGLAGLHQLMRIAPFTSLWRELGRFFRDPRLHQLFGRYATYCGTSPFEAPATLMLVAHVEREAVWQVEGGMARLAQALAHCGQQHGVRLRCRAEVQRLLVSDGRISGVQLADGERLAADAVIFNGDARALTEGLMGPDAPQGLAHGSPSLSALTWHAEATTSGFDLSHHNVFFGPATGYRAEFDAIAAGRLPESPTVYVCAQDRSGQAHRLRPGLPAGQRRPERLMCLVNAPADASGRGLTAEEIARCEQQMWGRLREAGLQVSVSSPALVTRPQDFAQRFPASQGALYGPASRGWRASFQARPDGRTTLPGLFLAGGSVHPGPGVPMAALSGQLAADQLLEDLASTRSFHPAVMPGGMSMR